ncbi:MAG: hypothetical protein LBR21_02345 [Propionibacteriaceae bacterium]|jgi:ATP synthase protein I|nr:hypothetical protein [Propionibacteriaceae bacterium]
MKSASPNSKRAAQLLVGGMVGLHIGAVPTIVVFSIIDGPQGFISSLAAALAVMLFFSIGQGVMVVCADIDPRQLLIAALCSYVGRVSGIALAMFALLGLPGARDWMLDVPVVVTTCVATVAWIAGEIAAYRKLRIPVYDSTERPVDADS